MSSLGPYVSYRSWGTAEEWPRRGAVYSRWVERLCVKPDGAIRYRRAHLHVPVTAGEAYRFCLVMGDLSTGKVVAKSVARARLEKFGTTQQLPHNNSSLDRNIARPGLFAISCRLER